MGIVIEGNTIVRGKLTMNEIDEILVKAIDSGASDVHITVGLPPKMRLHGRLIPVDPSYKILMPADTQRLLDYVMNDWQKRAYEQHGEHDFSYSIPEHGRFRVNAFKQRGTAAMALRLVNSEVPSPAVLGVPDSVIDLWSRKRGLILVTGPTGSGKSTTLASIINTINHRRDAHIITLEDPIEYLHRHDLSIVNQREIGLDTETYANALRAALREDPDVILVGEMRDYETISTAITAAETGHLVLSTLHTIGAASTVDRVIDVFPPHQQQQIRVQFAAVLEAVISQQLMPTLEGDGRVAAFEVLHTTNAVKNMIREGKSHQLNSVMQTNRKMGMITMDDSIKELYDAFKIDRETAIQFSVDPDGMEQKLL